MKNFGFKIKNYKCFGEEHQGFDKILPINIIIGKNNSGKSSLLDLVKAMGFGDHYQKIKPNFPNISIVYTSEITESTISYIYSKDTSGGPIPHFSSHYEYGKQFIGDALTVLWKPENTREFISSTKPMKLPDGRTMSQFIETNSQPFNGKIFKSINAERDIVKEGNSTNNHLEPNGRGATALIQNILNAVELDSSLIETKLLDGLNTITFPEIHFSKILVQRLNANEWEIYFEDKNKTRIALSKMGSGVKTILQVLLNLLVIPKLENRKEEEYVFLFEELENNLHPSLQRRLFNYIKNFSLKFKSVFFITTHSNVVIDSFNGNENAQIIHVSDFAATTVTCSKGITRVLDDLEIKASDILQSNGIIWVEGPSDRHYLNKWLNIVSPELKEGLHYSIMFYGGKLLNSLTFDYFEKELIPLLKINRNSYVLIDKDRRNINEEINKTKQRITSEIGPGKCWVTSGVEIENYLTDTTINKWLKSKNGKATNFKGEKYEKFEVKLKSKYKVDYAKSKSNYAKEITNFISKDDISIYDLEFKLKEIVNNIKKWNKLFFSEIEIYKATYGVPAKLIDITETITEQVSRGIVEGPIDPSTFGIPDPLFGTVKTLNIKCRIRGMERDLIFKDTDKTFSIE